MPRARGGEAVGADERQASGRRARYAGEVPGRRVDQVGGHHAIGRVFAAGDRRQPGYRGLDDVAATESRRVGFTRGADERAQPGEYPANVVSGERLCQQGVDLGQQVVDVGAAGHRLIRPMRPRSVGVADQPAGLGGDHEQDALLRTGQDPGRHRDPVAGHHEVNALRRSDLRRRVDSGRRAQPVGPGSDGERDVPRGNRERLASLLVEHLGPRDPVALAQQPLNPSAGRQMCAPSGSRAGDGDDHAGVVLGRVEELHGADEPVAAQGGRPASAPRRVRWRWRGTERAPPSVS